MSTKLSSQLFRISLAGIVLAVAGACSAPPPKEVNVTLKTFSMTLSSSTVAAGDVTFHVQNQATDLPHEFVVVKTEVMADKLPLNAEGNVDEEATDQLNHIDEIENIQTGTGGDLKVNLKPGHYVVICNTPGHYKGGMHADLTVAP